jgi:hypothetical protein
MKPLIFADIYRDDFITYGGLVSSSVIEKELKRKDLEYAEIKPYDRRALERVFSGQGHEPAIQHRLKEWLIGTFGERVSVIDYPEGNHDLHIDRPTQTIVEVKHNRFDPPKPLDELPGSQPAQNAVQQLFGYLLRSPRRRGVVTDGRSFRFYYYAGRRNSLTEEETLEEARELAFEDYLEVNVQDAIDSGQWLYLHLAMRLLLEEGYLEGLIKKSRALRSVGERKFEKQVQTKLLRAQAALGREDFQCLVVLLSTVAAIRTLEDHGCLPEYRGSRYRREGLSLKDAPFSAAKYEKAIRSFFRGETKPFEGNRFAGVATHDGQLVLDASELGLRGVRVADGSPELRSLFTLLGSYDFSELSWTFWSLLYQINANRGVSPNQGRYYTHPLIVTEIVRWFSHREARERHRKELPIFDPCVGSGNMLRTFLSHAQALLPGWDGPLAAAREMVATKLIGSDIDEVALWICKLSLATAVATRSERLTTGDIFKLNVFDTADWTKVRQSPEGFAIVSNPPWERPKFQLNYAFRELFRTGSLPKVGTSLEKAYEAFRALIVLGRPQGGRYYRLWRQIAENPELPESRAVLAGFQSDWAKFRRNYGGSGGLSVRGLSLLKVIRFCDEKVREVQAERSQYVERRESGGEEEWLGDTSYAAMFFSRMVSSLPANSKFAIVQPDVFFVGKTPQRLKHLDEIERYFSFSSNKDPLSGKRLFSEVDRGMRFGVVLGRAKRPSPEKSVVIFRTEYDDDELSGGMELESQTLKLDRSILKRAGLGFLPLFHGASAYEAMLNWIGRHEPCGEGERWRDGFHTSASKTWSSGARTRVLSSKALKSTRDGYLCKLVQPSAASPRQYCWRYLSEERLEAKCVDKQRVIIADILHNSAGRRVALRLGLAPKGSAIDHHLLWVAPKDPKKLLRKLNSVEFEMALYSLAKSANLNTLPLNWLGYD